MGFEHVRWGCSDWIWFCHNFIWTFLVLSYMSLDFSGVIITVFGLVCFCHKLILTCLVLSYMYLDFYGFIVNVFGRSGFVIHLFGLDWFCHKCIWTFLFFVIHRLTFLVLSYMYLFVFDTMSFKTLHH